MKSIKLLYEKKKTLEKKISKIQLALKILSFLEATLYITIIIGIIISTNLLITVGIIVLTFFFLRITKTYLKLVDNKKKKKIVEIENSIFLSYKL
jgi:hypothetical protein